jgi:hypothetical protein
MTPMPILREKFSAVHEVGAALRDAPALYKPHAQLLSARCALVRRFSLVENMVAQIAKLVLDLDSKGLESGRGCNTTTRVEIVRAFDCSWEWIFGRDAA